MKQKAKSNRHIAIGNCKLLLRRIHVRIFFCEMLDGDHFGLNKHFSRVLSRKLRTPRLINLASKFHGI